jgi:Ca-activated chloride channel family protein
MSRLPPGGAILLGLLAIAASVGGQPAGSQPDPPARGAASGPGPRLAAAADRPWFRSAVELVALEVCVKDRNGRFVGSLTPDDFLVLEDGIVQSVSLFVPEGLAPLAVALVIDRSSSMEGARLGRAKAAATAFLGALQADDLVELITFNGRVARPVPLGASRQAAADAIDGLVAGGQTSLFEAIAVGVHDLERFAPRAGVDYRKALVVLSDGEDTSSRLAFEDLLDDARRSGVLVYTISLRTDKAGRWLTAPYHLTSLARDTGGRVISVQDIESLTTIYKDIAAELRHLYRLGYVPSRAERDGAWRTVAVRVRNRSLHVRTRAGYYAPRAPSAFLERRR